MTRHDMTRHDTLWHDMTPHTHVAPVLHLFFCVRDKISATFSIALSCNFISEDGFLLTVGRTSHACSPLAHHFAEFKSHTMPMFSVCLSMIRGDPFSILIQCPYLQSPPNLRLFVGGGEKQVLLAAH